MLQTAITFILLLFGCAFPGLCVAANTAWPVIGVRAGGSLTDTRKDFRQYEAFAVHRLPWSWEWSTGLRLAIRLEGTAGALTRSGKTGFIGSLGPEVILDFANGMISLNGGPSATVLSEKKFGNQDFGGPFQFINHAGISFRFLGNLGIGYRFQHMSNARIYTRNPGLNMHMVELRYNF
jgi:lipid A 3-O-deacylase